jgi:uncharacterized protein (DUF1684 family)
MPRRLSVLLPGITLLALAFASPVLANDYTQSIETWRTGRLQRLTAPTGWLALIGRHPLEPGTWSVGSGEGSAIRLAAGPASLGTITCTADGKVAFALAENVAATIDGTTARSAELDYKGEKPTYVRAGTINFYILESGGKLFVRVRDTESARRRNFAGIEHYPVDAAWRIEASWVPFDPPRQLPITNVVGITQDARGPGKAVFLYQGRTYELLPMQDEPADPLFFVLTDTTAGTETYEASRFLYAEPPKDGKVILDFNKVYNPPCAFTPFTTCPLPPKENVLPFPLRAGEKKYQGPGAH